MRRTFIANAQDAEFWARTTRTHRCSGVTRGRIE